ncbi:hypothetical protein K030075H31_28290 [Blautia producta]
MCAEKAVTSKEKTVSVMIMKMAILAEISRTVKLPDRSARCNQEKTGVKSNIKINRTDPMRLPIESRGPSAPKRAKKATFMLRTDR